MPEQTRHFYHLYCGLGWEDVAREHAAALRQAGGGWRVTAGLAGPLPARQAAAAWLAGEMPGAGFVQADEGWEDITLSELGCWAAAAPPGEPVLYAHSKGMRHQGDPLLEAVWRRSMTRHLITDGRESCIRLLAEGRDAVGCHWLTPAGHPDLVTAPCFAGNFWWATAGYAASLLPLPRLDAASRWAAEEWIGTGNPRVADLCPGRPSMRAFTREAAEMMSPGMAEGGPRHEGLRYLAGARGPASGWACARSGETCSGDVFWSDASRDWPLAVALVPLCVSHRVSHWKTAA